MLVGGMAIIAIEKRPETWLILAATWAILVHAGFILAQMRSVIKDTARCDLPMCWTISGNDQSCVEACSAAEEESRKRDAGSRKQKNEGGKTWPIWLQTLRVCLYVRE